MPNVLIPLNDHIRRLARREIRAQTTRTKRAAAQHRRDIAALKRAIKALASRLASVEKAAGRAAPLVAASHPVDSLRFRADGLRSHRAKLGSSAAGYWKPV